MCVYMHTGGVQLMIGFNSMIFFFTLFYDGVKVIRIQEKPYFEFCILIFSRLVMYSQCAGQPWQMAAPSQPCHHEDKQPIRVQPLVPI